MFKESSKNSVSNCYSAVGFSVFVFIKSLKQKLLDYMNKITVMARILLPFRVRTQTAGVVFRNCRFWGIFLFPFLFIYFFMFPIIKDNFHQGTFDYGKENNLKCNKMEPNFQRSTNPFYILIDHVIVLNWIFLTALDVTLMGVGSDYSIG